MARYYNVTAFDIIWGDYVSEDDVPTEITFEIMLDDEDDDVDFSNDDEVYEVLKDMVWDRMEMESDDEFYDFSIEITEVPYSDVI